MYCLARMERHFPTQVKRLKMNEQIIRFADINIFLKGQRRRSLTYS